MPGSRFLSAAALVLCASGFVRAATVVEAAPDGVSVSLPGAASWSVRLTPAVLAQNLSFQLDRLTMLPAAEGAPTLAVQLRSALQAQVESGTPRDEAIAAQDALVQSLTDARVRAVLQDQLRSDPASGARAAERLERAAGAAASSERIRVELAEYQTKDLKRALAALAQGDASELDIFFDERRSALAGAASPAPAALSPAAGAETGTRMRDRLARRGLPVLTASVQAGVPRISIAVMEGPGAAENLRDSMSEDLAAMAEYRAEIAKDEAAISVLLRTGAIPEMEEVMRSLGVSRQKLGSSQRSLTAAQENLKALGSPETLAAFKEDVRRIERTYSDEAVKMIADGFVIEADPQPETNPGGKLRLISNSLSAGIPDSSFAIIGQKETLDKEGRKTVLSEQRVFDKATGRYLYTERMRLGIDSLGRLTVKLEPPPKFLADGRENPESVAARIGLERVRDVQTVDGKRPGLSCAACHAGSTMIKGGNFHGRAGDTGIAQALEWLRARQPSGIN